MRDECNVITRPICQCEFDWPTDATSDGEIGYLSLNYHMDSSKFQAYWMKWPMNIDWTLTGVVKKTA
jgi:hypothetical protein